MACEIRLTPSPEKVAPLGGCSVMYSTSPFLGDILSPRCGITTHHVLERLWEHGGMSPHGCQDSEGAPQPLHSGSARTFISHRCCNGLNPWLKATCTCHLPVLQPRVWPRSPRDHIKVSVGSDPLEVLGVHLLPCSLWSSAPGPPSTGQASSCGLSQPAWGVGGAGLQKSWHGWLE